MTENQIKIILSELIEERKALRDRDKILLHRIGQCHTKLDRIKSEKVAPPFLDPLIGKIIIINNVSIYGWNGEKHGIRVTIIRVSSWNINDESPSIIDIHYDKGVIYHGCGYLCKEWVESLNMNHFSVSRTDCNNECIQLYNGSEIQKNYGNKIDNYFQ